MKTFVWIALAVIVLIGAMFVFKPQPKQVTEQTNSYATSTATSTEQTATTTATTTKPVDPKPTPKMPTATIVTNKGTIVIELFQNDAPKTVENFITLAEKNFYDGVIFHRVIENFMIQGGDPTGTGRGGPGYKFEDELNPETESYKRGYVRGTVAMANAGPNTNGSQFFIMHKDYGLPHAYTIFGRVISGQEVVDAIATSDTDSSDRPLSEIKMESVTITR